jgi:cytochrome c
MNPARAWTWAAMLWCAATSAGAQAGDAQRGRMLYESRCVACHSVDAHRVGPAHQGVLGRKAGGAPGYAYSDALRASALRWDARTLDAWLADPEKLIPGQRMGYQVQAAADRADLVAYLASLK